MASKPELLRFVYADFKSKNGNGKERKILQGATDSSGNEWQLNLDPYYPTVALTNKGKHSLSVTLSVVLRDAKGRVAYEQSRGPQHFKAGKSQSFLFLIQWSKINRSADEILRDGKDLVIDIQICRVRKDQRSPDTLFGKHLLQLLDDEDTADVAFEVGGTLIYAHRTLFVANAPVLAAFSERSDKNRPVEIQDTSLEAFHVVLRYVYGGEIPGRDIIKSMGIELLGAANRFGVVGLKMELEAMIVQLGVVTTSNLVDFLLFADATSCAHLREHCMAFFHTRARDVLRTDAASRLKESGRLSLELLETHLTDPLYESSIGEEYESWSVEQLRRKLFKRGVLELDGSQRVLLEKWREHKANERKGEF
ncbi:hypothetical protein ACHAXT_011635 [Thalassiosira profunda]